MLRDALLYLEDIEESCAKVVVFTEGLTFEQFRNDAKTFDAVCRNLEIIGEATKHVPDELKADNPSVDWRRIAGLRDFLAHGYFALEAETLWDIAERRVPELLTQVRSIMARERTRGQGAT